MEKTKRYYVRVTLFIIVVGIGCLFASLTTDHWVEVRPEIHVANVTANKTNAYIYFGLFAGSRNLDVGLGDRVGNLVVSQNIKDMNLMDYGMWITVVILHLLAIVWAVVAAGFTLFNLFGKPIETITGPFGLYVWNGCAASFTLLSIVIFLILFKTSIYDENIFQQAEIDSGWRSVGLSHPSWSFYINLGALGCFLLNILLLKISDVRPCRPKPSKEEKTTHDDFIY
ncbi:clarin-2 isoform X2 [Octopus bimaculoides]|uniref:Clarin-3 n=1 Tax=Octopus bimaculoides TaxID=37653 RepID=A0A0L8FWH5_OCTBM|nr:clarin-2 isoform X2 [Octopus bimaculoides]|eukprot:XP_014786516.1 PREDICTED: clarin-2-like [Octopus bimaculoides]